MKMVESSLKGLWEKEKFLIMSTFSFSHSVLKRLVLQTHEKQGLFGKGLKEFAYDKLRCDSKVEICVGKGKKHCGNRRKNAGNQHFFPLPQCFQKAYYTGLLKVVIMFTEL